MSVRSRRLARANYRLENFGARLEIAKAIRVGAADAECRAVAEAALKSGEIMPPIGDGSNYRSIVAAGVARGWIQRPRGQGKGKP